MNYVGGRRYILQKVFVPKGSRVQETFKESKAPIKRWNPHYNYIIYDSKTGEELLEWSNLNGLLDSVKTIGLLIKENDDDDHDE